MGGLKGEPDHRSQGSEEDPLEESKGQSVLRVLRIRVGLIHKKNL